MLDIILINGPPRSGKDTLADLIWQHQPSAHREKFAQPLKMAAPILYGVDLDEWKNHFDTPSAKDIPSPSFLGKTPRQVQIAISESLLKPLHGKDVFGRMLVSRLQRLPKPDSPGRIVVVSDSGFRSESEVVVNNFGAEHTFLIRIQREGCSYTGDSRGYISLVDMGVREITFDNRHGLDGLARFARELVMVIGDKRRTGESEGDYYKRRGDNFELLSTDGLYLHGKGGTWGL